MDLTHRPGLVALTGRRVRLTRADGQPPVVGTVDAVLAPPYGVAWHTIVDGLAYLSTEVDAADPVDDDVPTQAPDGEEGFLRARQTHHLLAAADFTQRRRAREQRR